MIKETKATIPEVYNDLAKPAVSEVGNVAGRTLKALLSPIRGLLWGWGQIEQIVEEGVKKRFEKIPQERRKSPDPEIAVPLIQALSYTAQNATLREMYINLLEKCFIVFRLDSFSRNIRNEIRKGKKVYFYDNGVRNAIIQNFAPLELRNDVGALWENLMISERIKHNAYNNSYAQLYFWRTHDQKEIDLVEDQDGVLNTFEFKWSKLRKVKTPKAFIEAYSNSTFEIITPDNFWEFIR